jgi:hypothetical protein
LNWETKTEVQAYCFEIEKRKKTESNMSGNWIKVGKVNAFGNSNSPRQYSFTDKKINVGKYNYRLKMIDNDGTYNYSKLLDVEVEAPKTFALKQNYPNPFNPSTTISYQLPVNNYVTLSIYDVVGREVITLVNEEKPAGRYDVVFDGSDLSSGIYLYQLKAGVYLETKKFILLK